MGKVEALEALKERIANDETLPLREANLVFGEGNPDAAVLFIGEAPGAREDELCRPFVGRAGQLLDKMIIAVGWKREDVYITNIVKRRPPMNRDPLPEEIAAYRPYLTEHINIINPKIIAPLGRFAMSYFIPEGKISRDQGHVFRADMRFIVPLFHPAAALRATSTLQLLAKSFGTLARVVRDFDALMKKNEQSAARETHHSESPL